MGSSIKGAMVGVITGIAVGMVGHQMISQNKRQLKRKSDKLLNKFEELLENAQDMILK